MSASPSPSAPRLSLPHWLALAASVVPLAVYAFSPRLGDLPLYHGWARSFLGGAVPYLDFRFEYPPYALPWFIPAAWLGGTLPRFVTLFGLQLTLLDGFIKWMLLSEGVRRWGRAPRAWVPFAVYSVVSLMQSIHYLKRYDVIPATLALAALVALARRREGWAGAALAVGTVTKLYPAVLVPLALALCWKRGRTRQLVRGMVAGVLPLVPLSFFWPWWRFASFHVERGLQVESLGASLLWAAHLLGLAQAEWVHATAAYELHGADAEAVKAVTRWLWVAGSLGAAAVGVRAVLHRLPERMEDVARLALVPLVAFVVLNPVLSPQFLIWLTGAAALALLSGSPWAPAAILVAAAITRGIFAGSTYNTGINAGYTLLLLARNGLLLGAGVALTREVWRAASTRTPESQGQVDLGA
ncbi:glycosyltransferase 87 family protein [Hyalangium rubrum]|uniref:Glycosyltransferase 87 family protein n=1 Tax=Hyalangium rubrum TaxID=3103134 RepID=A0ABU5GZM2_9BACT|nr:glycosyltransferase 87 family protein [Hyalangium sp. s54d21]MDY7226638.1 glycosyltransferase 87 family protein [Hyalangium sp. s54d21]